MIVKRLRIVKYDLNGWNWQSENIINPRWEDIETALNRLDRYFHPLIWLGIDANREDYSPELLVIGGKGTYFIQTVGSTKYYFDDAKAQEIIQLWTSDQEFKVSAKNCCDELNLVKKIVKYYYYNGQLYPAVDWSDKPFK